MTLSAWIRPSASQSGWRTIMQRETDAYFLNACNTNGPLRPSGGGTFGGSTALLSGPTASPVGAWTHVALTYDGATMRLYVNGTQVASRAATGAIQADRQPIVDRRQQPVWRVLPGPDRRGPRVQPGPPAAEIPADMNAAVVPPAPDTSPPSAPDRADRDRERRPARST